MTPSEALQSAREDANECHAALLLNARLDVSEAVHSGVLTESERRMYEIRTHFKRLDALFRLLDKGEEMLRDRKARD